MKTPSSTVNESPNAIAAAETEPLAATTDRLTEQHRHQQLRPAAGFQREFPALGPRRRQSATRAISMDSG